jgi:hypothetical protein
MLNVKLDQKKRDVIKQTLIRQVNSLSPKMASIVPDFLRASLNQDQRKTSEKFQDTNNKYMGMINKAQYETTKKNEFEHRAAQFTLQPLSQYEPQT